MRPSSTQQTPNKLNGEFGEKFGEKPLPHDLDFFPVLELVRGGVGACVLAADERAVDAVGFNGGDRGAVLCPRQDPDSAAGVGGGRVR